MNEKLNSYVVPNVPPNCLGHTLSTLDLAPDLFYETTAVLDPDVAEVVPEDNAQAVACILRDSQEGEIYCVLHVVPFSKGSKIDHRPKQGNRISKNQSLDQVFGDYRRMKPNTSELIYLRFKP